jgi:hypothetical protein
MNKLFYTLLGLLFPYKTKEYRKGLYKKVREFYETNQFGFCHSFETVEKVKGQLWIYNLWRLPELYRYRPFHSDEDGFWFPTNDMGWEKRKQILDKLIS